jgi:hypothetical protein
MLSVGILVARVEHGWSQAAGGGLIAAGCLWYLWARTCAYRALVEIGRWGALARVSTAFLLTSAVVVALLQLLLP